MSTTEEVTVAVLLTQVASAQSLAAASALGKFKVEAVGSPIGAYAIIPNTANGYPEQVTVSVSKLVQGAPVILIQATSGQMKAQQYEDGELKGKLPVALVLDGAPHELEDILLGEKTVADLEDVVSSAKMSRFKAMRLLAASARAYKAKA